MKLSIIVPVYNVEKYISACLDSVVNQKYVLPNDYEVIVVNDGSPDRSAEIINAYDWKGCCHQVISQNNKGLGGARNTGLQYVRGEYVWFVDSDDYIVSNAISKILKMANGCDMINFGYQEETDLIRGSVKLPNDVKVGYDCLKNGFMQPAQFHVFKKKFLDDYRLRFFEGIYHEDTEFTPRCLYLAKNINIIQESLYLYQIREGSIMSTLKSKRAFDYLIVAESLMAFSLKYGETIASTPILNTICLALNNALFIISQVSKEEQCQWNKEFNSNPLFVKALMSSSVLKYKLEGLLFNIIHFDRIALYNLLKIMKK